MIKSTSRSSLQVDIPKRKCQLEWKLLIYMTQKRSYFKQVNNSAYTL